MKTKLVILIALSAIATLSFTFVATKGKESKNEPVATTHETNGPAGGLISEETR